VFNNRNMALAASVAVAFGAAAPATSVAATKYKNCTKLNKKYPHGVGLPGARDKSSGKPVTNFRVDKAVYNENKGRDRDKDGIACEKA
jgi:hypothetical protein